MVFSSMIFLWAFLPVTVIGNFLLRGKGRNLFLLLASLFFYAWGEPVYVFLMLCSILVNWLLGLAMDKAGSGRKWVLAAAVLVNVLTLGYFKYFQFFMRIVGGLFRRDIQTGEIALPIGISFFTFQILSYIIDLYRGKFKAQKNVIDFALYVSFFPQLIAGPIVKYKEINEQLGSRELTAAGTAEGIRRFIYGLGKKVIIANLLAESVDAIHDLDYAGVSCPLAWTAAVFYSLQIYYDFSGYSDMAIGLGKMFGFTFNENFVYPYVSGSIREFWRRWHISLGTWFKEYVYIPLGGNRKGTGRTYVNLLIVFFVTGLWHGAGFRFVLWGLYHGFFSVLERIGLKKFLDRHRILSHIYALLVILFGWVLFRANSVSEALLYGKRMLMPWAFWETGGFWRQLVKPKTIAAALAGILGCGILQSIKPKLAGRWKFSYAELVYCSLILFYCVVLLAGSTYNPFIYFKF